MPVQAMITSELEAEKQELEATLSRRGGRDGGSMSALVATGPGSRRD